MSKTTKPIVFCHNSDIAGYIVWDDTTNTGYPDVYKNECPICGRVRQCRCPDPNKIKTIDICSICNREPHVCDSEWPIGTCLACEVESYQQRHL